MHLNGVEYRVQFTLEVEREGFLPFLDVGITNVDGRLKTKVHRKPTHTQQYINWNSNHPTNMLLAIGARAASKCFFSQWIPISFGFCNLERVLEEENFESYFERYIARCGAG